VLVAGVPAGGAVSLAAERPAIAAANCTAAQKAKHARALAAYRKRMAKERAAYFKRHRSSKLRAAFIKRQQTRLATLQKAARCRVVRPPATPDARRGPLAAGTYRSGMFTPRFSFAVTTGWSLLFDLTETQVLLGQKTDPGGRTITFDSFGGARTVAERIDALRSIPGVAADPPVAATIGGFAGQRFDALTTASELVLVPGLADRYELEPGDRVRIYVIGVRDRTLTVIVEAPAGDWDAFLPVAEQVLATLQFAS
jgi:hypothetical protein